MKILYALIYLIMHLVYTESCQKIFEPFFTTKVGKVPGWVVYILWYHKDFNGTIEVDSKIMKVVHLQ